MKVISSINYCSQLTESINNVKYESITAQGVLAQLNVHILQFCVILFNISFSITGEKICNQMKLTIPFYPDTLQEVSLLQFPMSTPPPLLGQCPCRCMYIVLSLSIEIHNFYTSLYLLCTFNTWKELVVKIYLLTT